MSVTPEDYAKHFDQAIHRPWLLAALRRLEEAAPGALEGDPLRPLWLAAGRPQNASGAPQAAPGPNPLPVPWYPQTDSNTPQAMRMCFSSSCAMLLEFLRPGTLKGANGDDQYLATVQRFGDTTNATAQLKALAHYGVQAEFVTNADISTIERQIDAGIPVPCGFLHRGPVNAPSGGGHWLIVVGYDKSNLIVHDPFGEADLVTGKTIGGPARFMRYSMKNFGRRWMVDASRGNAYAPGTGWAIIAKK